MLFYALLVLLIVVIIRVYYKNREGFEDITANAINKATETVVPKPEVLAGQPPPLDNPPKKEEITVSGPGFDAMSVQQKAELLKDIQQVVKNEVLAQRQVTPVVPATSPTQSEAIQQGNEYSKDKPCPANPDGGCPAMPDMSQYIRKDQIPCWNCTLDY